MSDLNKEALDVWGALKPMIDQEISSRTQGMVQRRKAKVTTAPSLATNTIGVTEAFGPEIFLPFVSNMISAKVGDFVWIEWMYGATNAFVSSFAAVDDKNFTVAGTLDVVPRRCYATLSSAGWYRVCKTADVSGTIIDFSIGRPYGSTPAEAHRISFYVVGGGKSAFLNETSDTNTLFVDKIRCTYGGGFMYFDVHYDSSASNEVLVYFDVYGKGQANGTSVSIDLTSVAASPSGETVLTEYTFAANTVNHSDTTTSGVRTIVDRNGKLVTVTVESVGGISCASGQYTTVATLPSWAYPRNAVYPTVDAYGGNNIFAAQITTGGNVQLYPVLSNTSYYRLTCTYCTA